MLTTVVLASLLAPPSSGQTYHKVLQDLDRAAVSGQYVQTYQTTMPVKTGAEVLKVNYFSPNSPSGFKRLSGALFLPKDHTPRGLVVFFHGTSVMDAEVPSRFPASSMAAALPFLGQGFAVAMPDFVGQGDSTGRHPYPLGSINAWAGIDFVPVAREVAQLRGMPVGTNLFISGYSEGGAVAMWGARLAQERPQPGVRVQAAAPISGPYDLTGVTAQSMISDQSNPIWRAARVFLVAYIGYSAVQWVPGTQLADLYVPSFASYVPLAFETSKSDEDIMERLVVKAVEIRPVAKSIRPIVQPSFLTALQSGDLTNPVIRTLAANNCYDWTPRVPIRLIALSKDYLVSPENTTKTIRTMRGRGVPESLVDSVLLPDDLTHITGMPKCAKIAADYFAQFVTQ